MSELVNFVHNVTFTDFYSANVRKYVMFDTHMIYIWRERKGWSLLLGLWIF